MAAEAAAKVAVAPVSAAQAGRLPPISRPADDSAVAAEAERLRKRIAELEQAASGLNYLCLSASCLIAVHHHCTVSTDLKSLNVSYLSKWSLRTTC